YDRLPQRGGCPRSARFVGGRRGHEVERIGRIGQPPVGPADNQQSVRRRDLGDRRYRRPALERGWKRPGGAGSGVGAGSPGGPRWPAGPAWWARVFEAPCDSTPPTRMPEERTSWMPGPPLPRESIPERSVPIKLAETSSFELSTISIPGPAFPETSDWNKSL